MDSIPAAWLMAAGAVILGIGTSLHQIDAATVMVIIAFVVVAAAFVASGLPGSGGLDEQSVVRVLGVGVILEGVVLASQPKVSSIGYQVALLALTAVAGAHVVITGHRWRELGIGIIALGHFLVMAWMLANSASPRIDVFQFQQQGAAALLHGMNPYGLRFENTYGAGTPYYAPELQQGDNLAFGFVYPPLSLLLAIPGYVLAGDYRYGALAAVSLTGVAIALARPGRVGAAAAFVVLLAPITQEVVYWGWTEPFVVVMLAATVCLAARRATSTPVAIGLLISTKQYVAPVFVLAVVLLRAVRERVGWGGMTVVPLAVTLAVALPFIVWDIGALMYSSVMVHSLQPLRTDSMNIPAMLARVGLPITPSWLGFALAGVALMVSLLRAPRTVASFACATAIVLLLLFLFGKQAFVNYYFVVMAALACGVASSDLVRHGAASSPDASV